MEAVLNAMTTKTKAIYAKRLKEADYNSLMQKRTVPEIAAYLKNDTYYDNSLEGINEKALHRGQLEILIKNDLIVRLSAILRYAFGFKTGGLYNMIVVQAEINLITTVINSFLANDYSQIVSRLPMIIESHIAFDFKALAACRDFSELLDCLKGTAYYDIIAKYASSQLSELDFTGIEHELHRYYYTKMQAHVQEHFKGEERKKIENLFDTEVELDNITKIYRLKKYFNVSPQRIKELITPIYSRFSKNDIDDIIEHVDADHIFERLLASSYKHYIKDTNFLYIEHTTKMINYNMNRRQILFATDPDLVLYSYIVLMGIEIENIIYIIEAVRYRVPIEQIKRMLIY